MWVCLSIPERPHKGEDNQLVANLIMHNVTIYIWHNENRLALQDKRNLPDVVRASSDFETFRNLLENESSTNRLFNQASI